jgi:hypothetical protein
MSYVIENYSDLSIAVFGDLQQYETALINAGGSKNFSLKGPNNTRRTGIVFSKKREPEVKALLEKLSKNPSSVSLSTFSSSSSSTSSAMPSTQWMDRLDSVDKLVKALSCRLEAVENEVDVVKNILASNPSIQVPSTSSKKRPQSAIAKQSKAVPVVADDIDEDVMEDDTEEHSVAAAVPVAGKSLLHRRK